MGVGGWGELSCLRRGLVSHVHDPSSGVRGFVILPDYF